jgi:ABC-type transporter Mla MlaB component
MGTNRRKKVEWWTNYSARKFAKEVKRRKKRKKTRDYYFIEIEKKKNSINKYVKSYKKKIILPIEMDLFEKADQNIKFLNDMTEELKKERSCFFDLSKTIKIDSESILIFLGLLHKCRNENENINYDGNFPKNKTILEQFNEHNFFELAIDLDYPVVETKVLTLRSKNIGDMDVIVACKNFINQNQNYSGEENEKMQALYDIIGELMANTLEHANNRGDKNSFERWWLMVIKKADSKKSKFLFLDLGSGILRSHEFKFNLNSLKSNIKLMVEDNGKFLYDIFCGNVDVRIASNTNKGNRGLGLKGIYEYYSDNMISGLKIITNNVAIDFSKDTPYTSLSNSFDGTLICFEVEP